MKCIRCKTRNCAKTMLCVTGDQTENNMSIAKYQKMKFFLRCVDGKNTHCFQKMKLIENKLET
jgi:hypothetical protein